MSESMPWMKMHPADWLGDVDLQACSLEARGLWAEMLMLMWRSPVRGELRNRDGSPMDTATLARTVRITPEALAGLLGELRRNQVVAEAGGVLFQRRMVREEAERERAREGMQDTRAARKRVTPGVTGGVTVDVTPPVTGNVTGEVTPQKYQNLQSEYQNPPTPLAAKPKRERAEDVPIPPELTGPDFAEAWGRWLAARKARRKPVSATAAEQQLTTLAKHGPKAAIAAIERSIANDWTGLFPEQDHGGRVAGSRTAGITATRNANEYAEAPTPLPIFNLAPESSNANGGETGINGVHATAR